MTNFASQIAEIEGAKYTSSGEIWQVSSSIVENIICLSVQTLELSIT
jgi:hypothetical protein